MAKMAETSRVRFWDVVLAMEPMLEGVWHRGGYRHGGHYGWHHARAADGDALCGGTDRQSLGSAACDRRLHGKLCGNGAEAL
jgi:hypothetical protein